MNDKKNPRAGDFNLIKSRKNDTLISVKIFFKDMNKMTKWDKWILFSALILSLSFVLFFVREDRYEKKRAIVRVDGKVVAEILLDGSRLGEKVVFETKYGRNVLEVGDGWVQVVEASCRDMLDVKQGKIRRSGERIICLPHRFIVEMKAEQELELDAFSR